MTASIYPILYAALLMSLVAPLVAVSLYLAARR